MEIWRSILLLLMCAGLCAADCATSPKRPNIVFMLVDDLGWSDVSFHGSKQIPTPNVDAIAHDGIILNQYYTQPICSPSRGSLMTGKYPIQIGFQHFVIGSDEPWGLPLKEKILPQYLKELGYATHAVGKWHLGFFKEKYLPCHRGFDSFFGYYSAVEDYYTHFSNTENFTGFDLHNNREVAREYFGIYGTELYTDKAKKVIREHNQAQPLFLYLAQQAPHSGNFQSPKNSNFDEIPIQVPENYVTPLRGIKDEKRRMYAGMVSAMDYSVGEIFEALEESGMLDDTIFIFSTDNGAIVESSEGIPGSNWPLKGTKLTLWEGGIRGAAAIWSPTLRDNRHIYDGLMHISDWLPTLLSAVGAQEDLKMDNRISGVDQWASFTHNFPSPRSEILLNIDDKDGVKGIRRGNYKLVKESFKEKELDRWYDINGELIKNGVVDNPSPREKAIYERTYAEFLEHSKAARVLRQKYGKDSSLLLTKEGQIQVKCGKPRPVVDTCRPKEGPCLFDVSKDPCEFYNIAEQFPEIADSLEKAIDKYRPFMVPPRNKPVDKLADPEKHEYAWIPWK